MSDVNTTAAESSPAPQAAPEAPTVPTERKAYDAWRQTGKIEQPKAESAPAKKSSDTRSADADGGEGTQASEHAPDSEPGKKSQEHKPGKAEARLNELLEDLRRAGLSPSELKSFKREAQNASDETPKAEKKSAPEHTDKPAELKAPSKPKADDFNTWEEYEAARDKYFEDLADYKAQKSVADYRTQQAQEATEREMFAKVEAAKARYGEGSDKTIVETAKAVFQDPSIPAVLREVVGNSPVLVDLMYAIGSKPEELSEFLDLARSNPGQALRKAVLMEKLVQEELGKSGGSQDEPVRDPSGKFASTKAPAKVTQAPPPPKETSGRSAPPSDEVEAAAKANDFARFRAAANRRDLAARKGL